MNESLNNSQRSSSGGTQGGRPQTTGGVSVSGQANYSGGMGSQQTGGSIGGGQAGDKAINDVKQQAQNVVSDVKDHAQQIASEVTNAATEAAGQAKRQSIQMLERQKSSAAEHIAGFQSAIESASQRLRDEDNANLAEYADAAAAKLRQLRGYLDNRDLQDLMHDVEDFARKRPEVVFGGLAIAGLAVARFLKASSRNRRTAMTQNYNSGEYRSSTAPRYAGGYGTSGGYSTGGASYGSTTGSESYRPLQDSTSNPGSVGNTTQGGTTSGGQRPYYGGQSTGSGSTNNF